MPCLCTTGVRALRLTSLTRIVTAFGPGLSSMVFWTLSKPVAVSCTRLLPGCELVERQRRVADELAIDEHRGAGHVGLERQRRQRRRGRGRGRGRRRRGLRLFRRGLSAAPRSRPATAARLSWGRCAIRPGWRVRSGASLGRRARHASGRSRRRQRRRRSQRRESLDSSLEMVPVLREARMATCGWQLRVVRVGRAAIGLDAGAAAGAGRNGSSGAAPNRDGISAETGLLQDWPKSGPPQAWRMRRRRQRLLILLLIRRAALHARRAQRQ